jgi:peptide/nickel transport system substrate-binding protein
MRSSLRARVARVLGAGALAAALILPAGAPAAAADPVVVRVGTTQDLDSMNPYATLLVVGYEAFQLNYNLLVEFGPDLEPIPGYADTWERAADGKSWTFHIPEGVTWSDGTPATSADACFSWQLALDAIADGGAGTLGAGYLDPGLDDAGVTKVECPDPTTMIAYTEDASDRILQTYLPIIPKHIWGKETHKTIGNAKFEVSPDKPLVGTGPYQAVQWETGQFARFVRNPNYTGKQGIADEVVLRFFKTADTMVQALKADELDYARDLNPDQFKALQSEAGIKTVVGAANGWSQMAFNTYGTGTGKTITGGGPSTKALLDPAFRDALGYAVDRKALVDKVLGGYGDQGNTIVPPVLSQWHVEPDRPRTFDIELAKQKLDAAGYQLDGSGKRLDKEGKPITLRMIMPNTSDTYTKAAQFVAAWYKELGIDVTTQVLDSATVGEKVLPPEAGEGYTADYDIELWGWGGNVDPNALLQIFKCDAIGSSSDSQYCNPEFDKLYDAQLAAKTAEERKAILTQMQNLIYDEAPYDILFYDSYLDAYRTDRFAGWQNQPLANGTPLLTYGILGYTLLTDASAQPSAAPSAEAPSAGASAGASAAPTPAPSGDGGSGSSTSDNTPLLIGIVVVVAVVVVGLVLARRRSSGKPDDDDE